MFNLKKMKSNIYINCYLILLISVTVLAIPTFNKINPKDQQLILESLPDKNGRQFLQIYDENYDILAGLSFDSVNNYWIYFVFFK